MNKPIEQILKNILIFLRIDYKKVIEAVSFCSVRHAVSGEQLDLIARLRAIVPILAQHYSRPRTISDYLEFKLRASQSFQCRLMLKALESFREKRKITVVDIGDSSGTHMMYLKALAKDSFDIETISVNLDSRAIEKIRQKGLRAMHCRAEDLDLGGQEIDFVTAFSTVEHLHNPALFLRRLAKRINCNTVIITVPYVRHSRVGLYFMRHNPGELRFAEDEHIFELSPADWELIFLHAGWETVYKKTYYQYPTGVPILSYLLSRFWMITEWEGFLGLILQKDTKISDSYQDWEE